MKLQKDVVAHVLYLLDTARISSDTEQIKVAIATGFRHLLKILSLILVAADVIDLHGVVSRSWDHNWRTVTGGQNVLAVV